MPRCIEIPLVGNQSDGNSFAFHSWSVTRQRLICECFFTKIFHICFPNICTSIQFPQRTDPQNPIVFKADDSGRKSRNWSYSHQTTSAHQTICAFANCNGHKNKTASTNRHMHMWRCTQTYAHIGKLTKMHTQQTHRWFLAKSALHTCKMYICDHLQICAVLCIFAWAQYLQRIQAHTCGWKYESLLQISSFVVSYANTHNRGKY